MYASSGYLGELVAAPVDASYPVGVTTLQFDSQHEVIWAGTETGHLYTLQVPAVQTYAHWQAHSSSVIDLVATADGCLSLSAEKLTFSAVGGTTVLTTNDQVGDLTCCCLASGHASSPALVGRASGALAAVDLGTGKVVETVQVPGGDGAAIVRGPLGRGAVCLGTLAGKIHLMDPRTSCRVECSNIAHVGGLSTMDARQDTVATCGYGIRAGQVVPEPFVKVFDVRGGLRMLYSIPLGSLPCALAFHPTFSTTLLAALPTGMFAFADVASGVLTHTYQTETEGDSLTCAHISPSGEMVALAGTGGYLHLWADSHQPRANAASAPLNRPSPVTYPSISLQEEDSFSAASQYTSMTGTLLSDWDPHEVMSHGLPPRVVDAALKKEMKQVDFVGYIPNPCFSRGSGTGKAEAVKALAALRNTRMPMVVERADPAAIKAERQRQRAAAGGVVLPLRYQYVEIQHGRRLKWEEFDFSYYNRTRFAGLENDLPNAYCNALLQILYFVPELRAAVLAHAPEPDIEFCLTCEVSFLFKMLHTAHGTPCQATNLLRALRSLRETAALGLLDGAHVPVDTPAAAGRDSAPEFALSRRCAALSRFLLEQIHRDASSAKASSVSPRTGVQQPAPFNISLATCLEGVLGVAYRQRMQCLGKGQAEKIREARTFQVDLQYPMSHEKSARQTAEARELGLSRLPGATLASDPEGTAQPFSVLLQRSLCSSAVMRAWFDDAHGYQVVRQVRVPLSLPQVLAINCAVTEAGEAAWWMAPEGSAPGTEAHRLPWALAITSRPATWEVEVAQGGSATELWQQMDEQSPGSVRAVYELSAVLCQVRDVDEAEERRGRTYQGHLVSMIKVPRQYWEEPSAEVLSQPPMGALAEYVRTTSLKTTLSGMAGLGGTMASLGSINLPDTLDDVFSGSGLSDALEGVSSSTQDAQPAPDQSRSRSTSRQASQHVHGAASQPPATGPGHDWVLFNDFSISTCPAHEVLATFDNQKLPCMLYYTQVPKPGSALATLQATYAEPTAVPSTPLISKEEFRSLCTAPPLQGPQGLPPFRFRPLDLEREAPRPGMLFAIDAEFVAMTPPEKTFESNVEIQLKQSRLTLARVSVVIGEGPATGACCMDDYVRAVEPVYDYLTRYSGVMHGDLDANSSRHYLTTLKHTYMKLRYLLDCGCVFIGHDLRKDFRMINMVVPPEQVVDTSELYRFKRQRKLSLRFLASFVLGLNIQGAAHDAIEDARTALRLYQAYKQLSELGTFQDKLTEVYRWGKQYGWEPVTLRNGVPQPPVMTLC